MESYPFTIGIGASAGGLQALKDFFRIKQRTAGEAYVIILHSLRTHKSRLVDVLSRETDIKFRWIEDGLMIEPNTIYVNPSDKKVEVLHRKFVTKSRENSELINQTINQFFYSLAKDAKRKAIGIIMSGTGTDGTDGARAIEDNGGIVIVQDPATAQFDGMPLTSIRYDHPDYVLSPQEMPELIDLIVSGKRV
jgi:two-component system CheB/CheR fusion protein